MALQDFATVPEMLAFRITQSPDAPAFSYPNRDERWISLNWSEVGQKVRQIALGLSILGLDHEERCGIVSATRIDWILADLGILCAGGATTTVYPSNTADECRYILDDSETRFVFAENQEQVDKLLKVRGALPRIEKVILFEGQASQDGWVMTLAELKRLGAEGDAAHPGRYDEIGSRIERDHLATLIYTSGTTGRPKGVELTHDSCTYTGWAIAELGILTPMDLQFLWLPLSHAFGKVLEFVQLQVGFATAIDGRIPKLVDQLAVTRPTFMAAAPRIFEKVYNKVMQDAKSSWIKWTIFRMALSVGTQVSVLRQARQGPAGLLALKYAVADALVFSRLRSRFGGRIRFFISGAAPLSREMAEFFHATGLLILEGYGLTESTAASFVNVPESFEFGSVGRPLAGTDVKIVEDGEVLIRGRGIMRGYHNLPEATAEALTDGWLATGDIGHLTDTGHLEITDRKKDLIKTSGGKYVAPQKLEGSLKAACPYLSNVLVHGNGRNFCSALVTLDEEAIAAWASEHGLAEASGAATLANDSRIEELVQTAIDELNQKLASYETIKKFAILAEDFSVENGLLTPSLKVERKAVETRYKRVLDGFYEGSVEGLPSV